MNLRIIKVVAVCVASFLLVACDPPEDRTKVCKFHEGDLVTLTVSGQRAQITDVTPPFGGAPYCTYSARVDVSETRTHTHLIDPDGPITTRTPIMMWTLRGYELRPLTK